MYYNVNNAYTFESVYYRKSAVIFILTDLFTPVTVHEEEGCSHVLFSNKLSVVLGSG